MLDAEPVRAALPVAEEQPAAPAKAADAAQPVRPAESPKRDRAQEFMSTVALMLLGIVLGAAATILILRERVPEIQNLF